MFHNVLLGACLQPCSNRADTILYYYFHIKEEHFKMFLRQNYIRVYTNTHQIVQLFKNFLEGTCPLNIQYTNFHELPSELPSTLTMSLCFYK